MDIKVPTVQQPMSSLDGISTIAIDTDPDSNLYMTLNGLHVGGLQIVGVLPFKFFGVRDGYLVIAYDRTKDPRAKEPEEPTR